MNLQSDITTIKGVGEKSATLFAKLNIHTVKDLLFFFPRDYETFTEPVLISEAKPGELVTIRGIVMLAPTVTRVKHLSILKVKVRDASGAVTLTFFNMPFLQKALKPGQFMLFRGRLKNNNQMEQPRMYKEEEYRELLRKYDLVTTKKVQLNNSYYDGFLANHNIRALEMTGKVITEKYPEYADAFEQLVNGRQTYFGNILVTSKRVFGFISEFLLLVWVTVKKLRVYECKVGMLGEKAETGELKRCLAECFRNRDVDLAKKIFLETREKRPDVLMEASDITGELHLCMQIIATAGEERNHGETMILERENDFGRLMEIFSKLNRVVSRYRENSESEEDIRFLGEGKISKTAVWVAVMMGKESESEKKDLMDRMLKYLH